MQGDASDTQSAITGLLTHRLKITDANDITVELFPDEYVTIGSLDTLLEQPEFTNGTYTTRNNLTINVKEFIENMRIDDAMTKALVTTRPWNVSDTHPFNERLTLFYGLLYAQLTGSIIEQTPPK